MRIGYFSTIMGKGGGPAIVDRRLLERIVDQDPAGTYILYALSDRTTNGLAVCPDNLQVRRLWPPGQWSAVAMAMTLELKRRPVDLLHATFVPPLVIPGRYMMTMTCWSQYSSPELYPPAVRWRLVYLLDRGMKRASGVFCYTEYLKQKVIEKFNFPSERIFIAPPGVGDEMRPIEDQEALSRFLREAGIRDPYILFIGSLTKRKNVTRLIEAFHQLVEKEHIPHQLVLVGERIFLSDEIFETIARLKLDDRVVLTGRRRHDELPWFYSGADVYVLPTLSEGFGMTPVEAMACGTPVVASNVSCVPEVVGDAAVLVDPTSVDEIAAGIHACLTDESLRRSLIQRGIANASRFSWDKSARDMISAYRTVLHAGW